MGTRRWIGELESWLRRSGLTKEELAERSQHSASHVLALFEQPDPNPTLRLYLDLVQKAGARFNGVARNEAVEVIMRLKEILARENIRTVSALSKVSGVNRSQLSTLLNDPDPNPSLATFDRLVVALGAEQDFVLVSFIDKEVSQAVAVGLEEVQTVKQETTVRHLRAVPDPAPATSFADPTPRLLQVEAERAAEAKAQAKLAELTERVCRLHEKNVTLEKQHADDAAEIVRLRGANAALERLRAEDAAEIARLNNANRKLERLHAEDRAEIARLTAAKDWSLGRKILFGLGFFATGAGIAAVVIQARSPSA